MSLYAVPLDRNLTYAMVHQFLRLGDPEATRPQEGPTLDFKESIPSDIGDSVTALANTYGGLILLGVKQKRDQGLAVPEAIIGVEGGRGEVVSKVVNAILSTVQPRPPFSVGAVSVEGESDRVVVVLRVDQGLDTPYMYVGAQRNKVSVRVEDSNRAASREQIIDLVRRRDLGQKESERIMRSLGDPYVLEVEKESRSPNSHQIAWVPERALGIRLDRTREASLQAKIGAFFPRDRRRAEGSLIRTAHFTDVECRNREYDYHRKWRFTDDGAFAFTSKLGFRVPSNAPGTTTDIDRLGYLFADAISSVLLAKDISSEAGYYGAGLLEHVVHLYAPDKLQLTAHLPGPAFEGLDEMRGVTIPRITRVMEVSSKEQLLAVGRLERHDMVEAIAEAFHHQVRHLGGEVDWIRLVSQVDQVFKIVEEAIKS